MKAVDIWIAKNGKIHDTSGDKPEWRFPTKLMSLITGEVKDCADEIYPTEREAIKEHGKSQGGYFIEIRRGRLSGNTINYDEIAAVTVVDHLTEYAQHLQKVRREALKAAEDELRLVTIRSRS